MTYAMAERFHNIRFLSLVVLSTYPRIEKHIDDGIPKDVAETKILVVFKYHISLERKPYHMNHELES